MSTPSCHNTPHHPSASESPTNISNVGWNFQWKFTPHPWILCQIHLHIIWWVFSTVSFGGSPKKMHGFWRKKTNPQKKVTCQLPKKKGASKSMPIAEAKKSPQSLLSWWKGFTVLPHKFHVGKSSKFFMTFEIWFTKCGLWWFLKTFLSSHENPCWNGGWLRKGGKPCLIKLGTKKVQSFLWLLHATSLDDSKYLSWSFMMRLNTIHSEKIASSFDSRSLPRTFSVSTCLCLSFRMRFSTLHRWSLELVHCSLSFEIILIKPPNQKTSENSKNC